MGKSQRKPDTKVIKENHILKPDREALYGEAPNKAI